MIFYIMFYHYFSLSRFQIPEHQIFSAFYALETLNPLQS